ncbi:MAG: hypothetical protein J1E37_06370 [Prevotella sp.]|nr:hypothetical protein [Prevotella sp.]
MKRILLLLLVTCLLIPMANAQNKVLNKALEKEYKQKMKEYKKENWKLFGSSRSLDVALLLHYEKLNRLGDEASEEVGVASKFRSKNVGHQMAVNNACLTYAQRAGSHVRGRIVSDMQGDGVDAATEFDKFYAAYERLVEKEIKGEMKESYSIIRDLGNGTFEMQTYFIVDEGAASKARIRAMEDAARESEMAQKYAQKVSDFVREGFNKE